LLCGVAGWALFVALLRPALVDFLTFLADLVVALTGFTVAFALVL
jgi:hypothetical protein